MNTNFDKAVYYVLNNEGGFANDSDDSGGPTKYGVTQAAYSRYKNRVVPLEEISAMTVEEAIEFYRVVYWEPMSLEKIQPQIATVIFDTAVLYGEVRAIRFAQKVCTKYGANITIDGIVGPRTIVALNLYNASTFVCDYVQEVLARIAEVAKLNPKNEKYVSGWNTRAMKLLTVTA